MLRTVLWISLAALAILVVLWLSRGVDLPADPKGPAKAPAAMEAVEAPAEKAPEPEILPPAPPPPPTPDEVQIQEDAAATGMTTVEPAEPPPAEPPPQ